MRRGNKIWRRFLHAPVVLSRSMTAPKAFISYSWTSDSHQKWVIDLATQLRESGVDVILDKWDLREGHDAIAFMEKMVTDESVRKVVMILDRNYADKADKRAGGVGTEAQIISSEVYGKIDQTKFVGVASELNADGKPFTPAYYKSRIYIDLSSEDIYASNFEQLLRWIFDKPLHAKPTLGKPPEFLSDRAVTLGTGSRARRAKDQIQNSASNAEAAFEDYLLMLAEELEKLKIVRNKEEQFDDQLIRAIENELPYRTEYIEVLSLAARYWNSGFVGKLQRFLEKVAAYQFRPADLVGSWFETDFDIFRFIANELFLHTIAILIRSERMAETNDLLSQRYYLGDAAPNRQEPMKDFIVFNQHIESLQHRNQRLSLRRLSLHADLIEQRSHGSGTSFRNLMQADFILFLRMLLGGTRDWGRWWPFTLVFAERMYQPFEVFARAESSGYFKRLMPVLGISSKSAFESLMSEFNEGKREAPRWQFNSFNPAVLSNWAKIATIP
jgi:TIR domain